MSGTASRTAQTMGLQFPPSVRRIRPSVPKIWEAVKGSPAKPVARPQPGDAAALGRQIAARAAAFIKRSAEAGTPFYAHVCFTHVHPPYIHHPDFTGRSGGGVISDILAELDYRTGQVLDAIDAAGIADNTIVVWSSDNPVAPAMAGSNGPWRGNFASGFEGGMRAPAMARWPGKVAVGRRHRRDTQRCRLATDAGGPRRRKGSGTHRPTHRWR